MASRLFAGMGLMVLSFGCSNSPSSRQCQVGEQRCLNGTTLELCAPANPDAVDPGPPVWLQRPCRSASLSCVTLANGGGICVDPTSFDVKCGTDGERSYCRADGQIVQCSFGYRNGVLACSGSCVETSPGFASCIADGGYQD